MLSQVSQTLFICLHSFYLSVIILSSPTADFLYLITFHIYPFFKKFEPGVEERVCSHCLLTLQMLAKDMGLGEAKIGIQELNPGLPDG